MYTATLKSKTFQRAANRILVVVEITNSVVTFDKEFSFAPKTEVEAMKRTVKSYLNELNQAEDKVTALADLDYTEPVEDNTPTAEEQAFQEWSDSLQKLVAATVANSLGIELATASQLTTLKNRVQTNMVKTDDKYVSALAQYANVI